MNEHLTKYEEKNNSEENNNCPKNYNSNNILEKIHSKFVLQNIFSTAGKNLAIKLIKISKSLQKKIGIDINYYKNLFFQKNIFFYLRELPFKKGLWTDQFEYYQELSDNEIDFLKNFNFDFLREYIEIEPDSPTFDIISKTEYFNKHFTIFINTKNEPNFNETYYKEYFPIVCENIEKMNKSNIQYSSVKFLYLYPREMENLKSFNINFKQIKQMEILKNKYDDYYGNDCASCGARIIDELNENDLKNIGILFDNLFSLDIENSLVSLTLDLFHEPIDYVTPVEMNPDLFKGINKLKSLKKLTLVSISFETLFKLKLVNLEELVLLHCGNIILEENMLKCLSIGDCKYKEFEMKNSILSLPMPLLEEIHLEIKYEKSLLEKLCSKNSLKKIDLSLGMLLEKNEILNLGKMESPKELILKAQNNFDLCNFQSIFINLTNITINGIFPIYNNDNNVKVNLEIIENPNSKINNLKIIMQEKMNIQVFIKSYEDLESISLVIYEINLNTNFPIFSGECLTIFKSLKSFKLFICYPFIQKEKESSNNESKINLIINNMIMNINKMPNITEFVFKGKISNEILYKNLINKLLLLKSIIKINLDINDSTDYPIYPQSFNSFQDENPNEHHYYEELDFYSLDELKIMFPNINIYKVKEIHINRFDVIKFNLKYSGYNEYNEKYDEFSGFSDVEEKDVEEKEEKTIKKEEIRKPKGRLASMREYKYTKFILKETNNKGYTIIIKIIPKTEKIPFLPDIKALFSELHNCRKKFLRKGKTIIGFFNFKEANETISFLNNFILNFNSTLYEIKYFYN